MQGNSTFTTPNEEVKEEKNRNNSAQDRAEVIL